MLGTLLFAREHFAFEALVFGFIFAAAPRAGDGAIEHVAPLYLHQHLRGAAHDSDVVELKTEQIRRGIQGAQLAVDFEGLGLRFCREPLAEHDLENVARADVLFGFSNDVQILRPAEVRIHLQRGRLGSFRRYPRALAGDRPFEKLARFLDFADRRVIFCAQATLALGEHVSDDP